jgi:hypothetical protein
VLKLQVWTTIPGYNLQLLKMPSPQHGADWSKGVYGLTLLCHSILHLAYATLHLYTIIFCILHCIWLSSMMNSSTEDWREFLSLPLLDLWKEWGYKAWLWPNCLLLFQVRSSPLGSLLKTSMLPMQRETWVSSWQCSITHQHSFTHQMPHFPSRGVRTREN